MSKSSMQTEANATACPDCKGKGTTFGYHRWSDGLGGVEYTCLLCNGKGELVESLRKMALRYKREAAEAANQLSQLSQHVGLLLVAQELDRAGVEDPEERSRSMRGLYEAAPGPSTCTSTWAEYVEHECGLASAKRRNAAVIAAQDRTKRFRQALRRALSAAAVEAGVKARVEASPNGSTSVRAHLTAEGVRVVALIEPAEHGGFRAWVHRGHEETTVRFDMDGLTVNRAVTDLLSTVRALGIVAVES